MGNIQPQKYDVIGLMSGTSLDGLDIAFCSFVKENTSWNYHILVAETIHYPEDWLKRLKEAEKLDSFLFQQLNADFGFYLGQRVSDFIIKHNIKADFVSSHGHTIFHQPEKKITVQIGSGAAIASKCKLPVVYDLRSLDVSLGGQGAPLVPIGDRLLFSEYDLCLNLGGFANISYEHNGQRIAFDVCPVNIVMNELAERAGKKYDDEGKMAREGLMSYYLLTELNQLGFYKQVAHLPRSLGKEWVMEHIYPLLEKYELEPGDLLRTFAEHIAMQVAKATRETKKGKMLITGGGAYNSYLIERISDLCEQNIVVPDNRTIEFKEALIFAFLGVLRIRNEVNCLKSVTGAVRDSCGGSICQG